MLRSIATALLVSTVPGLAAAQAACLVGPHPGFADADAETVATIVCAQLRREGVSVGEPVHEAEGAAWRTSLRPLGRKTFLSLQRIAQDGVVQAENELLLQEIEEVPVAAPRLVQALVNEQSLESTATVSNLVGEEVRPLRKKGGETFWGLGFVGLAVPGTDMTPGAGAMLRSAFETEHFGVIGDLRISGGSPGDDAAFLLSAGVGGRFFLLGSNTTPFLGLGMGWTVLAVEEGPFEGSQSGLGGWVEVGLETLRFYETRLSIDLRAELPFYELGDNGWNADGEGRYFVPLTLGVTYMW